MEDYINLCLVKTRNNDIVPVVVPKDVSLGNGDIVYVPTSISDMPAEVVFVRSYVNVDDDFWTMAILTTGLAPIRVKKYGYMYECKWEDKDDEGKT